MINKEFCILIDDDATFVRGTHDLLRNHFTEFGIGFEYGLSLEDLRKIMDSRKDENLLIAILDLWFIDKKNLNQDENAGFELLDLIREEWINSYVIILSSHIDEVVRKRLKEYFNIAIFEKPMSTSTLLDSIDVILKEIRK